MLLGTVETLRQCAGPVKTLHTLLYEAACRAVAMSGSTAIAIRQISILQVTILQATIVVVVIVVICLTQQCGIFRGRGLGRRCRLFGQRHCVQHWRCKRIVALTILQAARRWAYGGDLSGLVDILTYLGIVCGQVGVAVDTTGQV